MSSMRLFILGALARSGPMHGYQIHHQARVDRTELWTDVRLAAIYGALKRLAHEGLIEAARSEREGRLPERTVYQITDAGRRSMEALRQEGLSTVAFPPDPFDLALVYAETEPAETLHRFVETRNARLAAELANANLMAVQADPYLTPAERLVMRHRIVRLEAEVAWHRELSAGIADFGQVAADHGEKQ